MGPYVLLILTCSVFLPVNHVANGFEYNDDAIKRGDSYVDKILKDMFEDGVEKYDPYRIEDSSVGFHKKVGFINVDGEAKFHSGEITGLSTLHRYDHCSLREENGRLKVKADLGAGVLNFRYSGTVKFMSVGPTVKVYGKLVYVEVHTEFDVDSKTGKDGKLRKFIIDDIRGMEVRITGLGPLNWALNPIVSGVTVTFKRFLKNVLESKVKKHIAKNINDFQFPIEGNDLTTQTEPTEWTSKPETDQTETEPQTTETETETETETKPQTTETETETEPQTTETETETETEPPTNETETETELLTTETETETEPQTTGTEAETEPQTTETETEQQTTETEAETEPQTTETETEQQTTETETETEQQTAETEAETEQ